MNIVEIARGNITPLTLEERIRKALANIDRALEDMRYREELESLLSFSGREYLINQRMLLQALLDSESW